MKKLYNTKSRLLLSAVMLLAGIWSAKAQFPDPYCVAEFPEGVEPITSVVFAGINQQSSNATTTPEMENYTGVTGNVTPTLTYHITLKGNTNGAAWTNYFSVYFDWNNDGEFGTGEGYNVGTITNSTGLDAKTAERDITVPPNAVPGNTRMRVVKRYSGYGGACNTDDYGQTEDYTIVVAQPPACVSPSDIALVTDAGSNTAQITWVAPATAPTGGYEYYLSTTNTAPLATATGIDNAGITLSLSGLPANTVHYLWVRSDCGSDTLSAWSSVFSFTTACDIFPAPFTQNFSAGTLPLCWTNTSTVNTGNALWKFAGAVGYAQGNTRADGTFAWVDGSDPSDGVNDVTLISPPISLGTLTAPQLVFDYFSNNADEFPNNILTVEVFNGTVWNTVFTDDTSLATWRTITLPLTGLTGTIQVRFIVDKTAAPAGWAFYNDILLDNVIVQETPACAPPTGLIATTITDSQIDFEWTDSSSNPTGGYEYEVRTSGAAGSGATGLVDSGTSTGVTAVFDGLTPDTDYVVYVRANCGSGVFSPWASEDTATIPTPPANDECTGAVALTVNADFECAVVTSGTTVSATLSMEADPCYGNPEDDVWYSFVATHESHTVSLLNIVAVTGGSTDMYIQVLSGTCDGLDSVLCSDPESTMATGLVIGETYFVRVYNYYTNYTNTFDICIGSPPAAPANDDCAGAVALTVNADYDCAVVTTGTTAGATESMAADPCFGDPDDDVWYSFVATGEAHNVRLLDIEPITGFSTDMYVQLLSGTCDALESVGCSDDEMYTFSNLVAGETYFVRVYSYGTTLNTFSICIGTPPAPPANDDCEGAVVLTVNADFDCAVTATGTTAGATESMEADPCFGDPDDDVWYQFTATGDAHSISLTNITTVEGWSTDMYFQVLSGGACGSLESLECSDDESAIFENLVPGEVYFVRVYTYGSSRVNFTICVGTVPPPPANDDCEGAIALIPGGTFNANPVVGSNGGATASDVIEPDCGSWEGADVWYSVVVPASGSITIETAATTGGIADTVIAAYTGECGSLTEIDCDDDSGTTTGNYSLLELDDLTPGETIYIMVWEYASDAYGTFRISAYDGSLSTGEFTADGFRHYPNPVKDVLNISHTADITSVKVYNMLGQQVMAKDVNAAETAVDMSALADGPYVVNVTSGNNTKTIKIVKKQ